MAVQFSCDCCGDNIEGKPREFGYAVVRQYCDACAPDIQSYMDNIDALHTKVAEAYREGKERCTDGFREAHRATLEGLADCIKLPDVP